MSRFLIGFVGKELIFPISRSILIANISTAQRLTGSRLSKSGIILFRFRFAQGFGL